MIDYIFCKDTCIYTVYMLLCKQGVISVNFLDKKNPIILNQFLKYLFNVRHYSISTINEYRLDIMMFFKFIKDYLNISVQVNKFSVFIVRNVKREDIVAFLVFLNINRNCTACTRKRKLSAIKAFYRWLFFFYPVANVCNPAENLPSIQEVLSLPKYLSIDDAKRIINVFDLSNSKYSYRNNAIIALFLNCGLRVSELSNIRLCDLYLDNCYIRIIGKGNKERIVWLNKLTKKKIEEYLVVRNKNLKVVDSMQYLFLSHSNTKLSVRMVEIIVNNAYKLAGIGNRGYTTHTLRHTSATIMYQYVKSDMLLLKEFLGHSTIKSTEIYTHISNEKGSR